MIRFSVTRTFSKHRLELSASLPFAEGSFVALCGRSGSGKSSLLHMLAGLHKPEEGRIALDDLVLFDRQRKINLPPEKRPIGYAFQDTRLFPHKSVESNLRYGMRRAKVPSAEEDFALIVRALSLSALLDRYPAHLSGGERQRIALARCLLTRPRLLLLDEPLAFLDRVHKRLAIRVIKDWVARHRATALYVSHILEESASFAEHVITLRLQTNPDGMLLSRVGACGSIGRVTTSVRTAEDIGGESMSVVHARLLSREEVSGLWCAEIGGGCPLLVSVDKGALTFRLPLSLPVRVYATDVLLCEDGAVPSFDAEIVSMTNKRTFEGRVAQLRCGNAHLLMAMLDKRTFSVGESVRIRICKAHGELS